jgi:hypothetical protein
LDYCYYQHSGFFFLGHALKSSHGAERCDSGGVSSFHPGLALLRPLWK